MSNIQGAISYERAAKLTSRLPRRKLANNTYLTRADDGAYYAITLHNTVIIRIFPDRYLLNTGGWRTGTTKARLNEYLPFRIVQAKGVWYIQKNYTSTIRTVFFDGAEVTDNGDILNIPEGYSNKDIERTKRKIDKLVSGYIKGFTAAITAGGIPEPGDGDCWGCLFKQGDIGREYPGRQEVMGLNHYFIHFHEGYYVPSLLANAILSRGYRVPEIIWDICVNRRDVRLTRSVLTAFFRKLKPDLLECAICTPSVLNPEEV